jgi:hypothetical protein
MAAAGDVPISGVAMLEPATFERLGRPAVAPAT